MFNQKGFAALFITMLVLTAIFGIIANISFLTLNEENISSNIVKSTQAYYTAESGIEDALLRLKQNPGMVAASYSFNIGNSTADITIPNIIGDSRTVTSLGNNLNRNKKVQMVFKVDADLISFHYGAQVGDGGLVMGNNSKIKGNVFSNGSISGSNGAEIQDSAIVAHNGNKITNMHIGGDAFVHTCEDSIIDGDLTYVLGGSASSCTAGGSIETQADEISPMALPISQSQIIDWKNEAAAGGIINSDVVYTNSTVNSLGPKQIGTSGSPKNLTVTNNARLKITGTVYVTGNINISNNAIVELDNNAYGSFSGIVLADGKINSGNNAILRGSGSAGSYLMLLSTNSSVNPASPAIMVSNNAQGAIFYANNGMIYLSNGMEAKEITGYKVQLNNNAEIEYESGLESSTFFSGPGGSWQVESWKEVE